MTNKETVVARYGEMVEVAMAGKGEAAKALTLTCWDDAADDFVSPARLAQMGYVINDSLVANTVKGIAQRNPKFADGIKALKN